LGLEFVLCIAALLLAYHLGMRYIITYRLTTRAPAVANPEVDRHGNFFGGAGTDVPCVRDSAAGHKHLPPVELMPEEHIPDEFEIVARIWAAQDMIVREAYAITERLSLDPTLAEHMDAGYREQDVDAFHEAQTRFFAAVVDAPEDRLQ
jgi:hypothetical protein